MQLVYSTVLADWTETEQFYGTLIGITTPGQSGPESNGNEEILHIPQTPTLELYHQLLFNVILKTVNGFKYSYLTLIIPFTIIHLFAQLNGFKYCYLIQTIQFNTNHFSYSKMALTIVND